MLCQKNCMSLSFQLKTFRIVFKHYGDIRWSFIAIASAIHRSVWKKQTAKAITQSLTIAASLNGKCFCYCNTFIKHNLSAWISV